MSIKKFKEKDGVSEILGTVLLLGIAVIIFSSLIVYVLSMDTGNPSPDLNMVGYLNEDEHAIVEHRGGDPLPIEDLTVTIWKGMDASKRFEGSELIDIFRDSNGNLVWDTGDYIDINCPQIFGGVAHWQISLAIVDTVSNSIVMSGVVQTGYTEYLFTNSTDIEGAADFTWNPEPACVRDAVAFDPSSSAHSSYIVSYYWTFGDGSPASTLAEPAHQYATHGTYTVTLNITYAPGVNVSGVRNWDTVTKQVTVSDIPHITDNSPDPATTGDPYTFSATVTDLDGIHSVFVRYRFGSGATTNVSMTNVGGSTWECTITIPSSSLNDLYYSIAANDTLGFWNSTGTL
ncbi:MAG: PKD domain-containing protein, partial [Thermoplasmatota archaeon]